MKGATIGQYRITGLIGQGGMGAVYAAEHTLLGRPAAIKVLLPELSQKQDVVMRFFNEARAATAIRHPSIVEIYDFGWTPEGAAFIVMERLDGESLADRSARARFRWPVALAIARQISGALSAAHAKGIVHRDLKPDNVFLVLDPEVPGGERIKLLDFGIAKLAGETSSMINVTKTGAVMGTPTYMAPEQCRGIAIDHRADLYALGCVVFELCCGRPPFVGEGTGDVLAAHIHVPAPSLASLGAVVPPAVEQLVQRLLAKAPGHRVQSADELIRAIDAVTGERAVTSSPGATGAQPALTAASLTTLSGAASTSPQLPTMAASRRRIVLTLAVAVAAAASAAIVVVAMRGGVDEPTIVARPAAGRIAAAEPALIPDPSAAARPAPAVTDTAAPAVATQTPSPPATPPPAPASPPPPSTTTPPPSTTARPPPPAPASPPPPTATASPPPPSATAPATPPTATAPPKLPSATATPPTATASAKPPSATASARPPSATATAGPPSATAPSATATPPSATASPPSATATAPPPSATASAKPPTATAPSASPRPPSATASPRPPTATASTTSPAAAPSSPPQPAASTAAHGSSSRNPVQRVETAARPASPRPAPAIDSVEVAIDSTPAGAQVVLDGSVLGKTPFHGSLPRRDRDVALVVRLAGYADKTIVIHTDQAVTRRLSLVKAAAPRPRPDRDQSVNPFGN